jgi:hypothetical protein
MWDILILKDNAHPSFYSNLESYLKRIDLFNIVTMSWTQERLPPCKLLLAHGRGLSRIPELPKGTRFISLGGVEPALSDEIIDELFMLDPFGYRMAAKKAVKNKVRENAKKKQSPKKQKPPAQKKPTPTEKIKARKKPTPQVPSKPESVPTPSKPESVPTPAPTADIKPEPKSPKKRSKPLYQQIEDKYSKKWRGENPISGKSVGFWTVKGWLHSEDTKLKSYAEKMFRDFKKSVKLEEEGAEIKEVVLPSFIDNGVLPISLIKENTAAFNIDIKQPLSDKSFNYLTTEIRSSFRTQGYNRNFVEQYVDKKIEGYKSIVKLLATPFIKFFANKKKDQELQRMDDLAEVLEESKKTDPSLKLATTSFAAGFAFESLMPTIAGMAKAPAFLQFFTAEGLGSVLSNAVSAKLPFAAKAVALKVPLAVPFLGGSPIVAGLIAMGIGMVVAKGIAKLIFKNEHNEYDEITVDVFRGDLTPEELEKEYNKRLDAILKKKIPREEMQKEIRALYEHFQEDVRPAIEKALYMAGKNVGKGTSGGSWDPLKFLKTGADSSKPKAVVRMRRVLEQINMEKLVAKSIISKGFNETLTKTLRGEIEMDKNFLKGLQTYLPKG